MNDGKARYCFDTSAFVAAWVRQYPNDHFPSLWLRLDDLIKEGRLIAISEVRVELGKKDDRLSEWCGERGSIFAELDVSIQLQARAVLKQFPTLVDTSKGRGRADPFVVALAIFRNAIVVTDEQSRPSNPKIPDACLHFGVQCMTVLQLIRQEGWRF